MRAAVWVISVCVTAMMLLESGATDGSYPGRPHNSVEIVVVTVTLISSYAVGGAFVMVLPLVSSILFTVGGLSVLVAAVPAEFVSLHFWGALALILAVLAGFGSVEKRKRARAITDNQEVIEQAQR